MATTPEQLLPGLVSTESGGKQYAVSPKGAIGYTQITPALAKDYGYRASDISDPGVQWDIYRRHMTHLLSKYAGDVTKALAAWNAGEGNVDRGRIPAETRAYVPKVLSRTPGAGSMAQYQYSPSTNTYWMKGPAGRPIPVPPDQVPADIRAASSKRFGARAAAPVGRPSPAAAPTGSEEIPPWMGTRVTGGPGAAPAAAAPTTATSGAAALPARVPTTPPPAAPQSFLQNLQANSPENLLLGSWSPTAPPEWGQGTAEQRYERGVGQLPEPAQMFMPQTLGEQVATASRATAPETGGLSLAIPAGMGAVTGYLEPGVGPTSPPWVSWPRAKRAVTEAVKEVVGQTGTRAVTAIGSKGVELLGRYKAMPEMVERMTARVGQGIENLFNRYPLAKGTLNTIDDITHYVSNGRLKEEVGGQIDRLTDEMEGRIPKYTPAQKPPYRILGATTPTRLQGVPATGEKFELPDVDTANNTIVMREFDNVRDAIRHTKKLSNTGFGKTGPKSGSESFLYREANHQARDIMRPHLNDLGKQYGGGARWGDQFAEHNADYGTANILEKNFKGTLRTARIRGENKGILDQATLLKKVNKEMPDLRRLHPNGKPDAFQRSIAPTLGESTAESFTEHPGSGLWERLFNLLGAPYMPETRAVMPQPYRTLSSPEFRGRAWKIATTPAVSVPSNLVGGMLGAGQPEAQQTR